MIVEILDTILEFLLGESYTVSHVIVLCFGIIGIFCFIRGGRK